jgi:hypothetical protein
LKLSVDNLLNSPFRFTHGTANEDDRVTNRYRVGSTAMFYVTWTGQ